jgi:hypothetical protein
MIPTRCWPSKTSRLAAPRPCSLGPEVPPGPGRSAHDRASPPRDGVLADGKVPFGEGKEAGRAMASSANGRPSSAPAAPSWHDPLRQPGLRGGRQRWRDPAGRRPTPTAARASDANVQEHRRRALGSQPARARRPCSMYLDDTPVRTTLDSRSVRWPITAWKAALIMFGQSPTTPLRCRRAGWAGTGQVVQQGADVVGFRAADVGE